MPLLSKISSFFKTPAVPSQTATARHILDFSENRCKLRKENCQLVVEKENDETLRIPFSDIAVVIIANSHVTLTQPVLESIAAFGAMLVICDYRYLPVSMMMPIAQYSSFPLERLHLQIGSSLPLRKQAWQQVVKAKIRAQAKVLRRFHETDSGLLKLAEAVKSGDPDNIEAQAARKYWPALFPNLKFTREQKSQDPLNARLNYGYTVLRAIVARAVCAVGFHPALGIHHCNMQDSFCLADDLMEPFRPLIDEAVYAQYKASGKVVGQELTRNLSPEIKRQLISSLSMRFCADQDQPRKLFDHIAKLAQSLVKFYAKETDTLYLPDLERKGGDE